MPKTTKRGRPSKDIQTQSSSYCIIKDPLMEPFYISKDATNFTVIEKTVSTRGFAGRKATGKEVEKISGLAEKDYVKKDKSELSMAEIDLLLQEVFTNYMGLNPKGQ